MGQCAGDVDTAADAEFAEDVAGVAFDRLGGDEQVLGDLPVGGSAGDELGDPQLGRREGVTSGAGVPSRPCAGQDQLVACPCCEGPGSAGVREIQRSA